MIKGRAAYLAVTSAALFLGASGAPSGLGRTVTRVQNALAETFAGPQFSDAAVAMERFHQLSGTYDGADFSGRRISVRWATGTQFCIDGVSQSGVAEYLLGPGGSVAPGACPLKPY